ncbi:MAG: hypothetical protein E7532_03010 [Ruminococcaceae bacterium]|nr:hypothetical protein [Oscillospiraceae bacterium]
MKTTKKNRTKIIHVLLIAFLVVVFVVSGVLLLNRWESGQGLFPAHDEDSDNNKNITVNGVDYTMNPDIQTILLLGLDKFEVSTEDAGYKNDRQADFLMLFVINNSTKSYSAIHLNRDTIADINVLGVAGNRIDTISAQLALAHTYGNGKEVSCRNTADAVSSLFNGIDIQHYMSVTMDAVPMITDLVGGVEVEITDDFTGVEDAFVMGETVTLTGENVLTYVRTRQGLEDSTNTTRMQRQKTYLSSFFDAFNAKVKEDENFALTASTEISEYMVSNYTINQLENLINNLSDYEFTQIYDVEGESKVGEKFMEFHVDKEQLNDMILNLFYLKAE